jgi:hypothetical protein
MFGSHRFRSVPKLYGFILIVGSGAFEWLRIGGAALYRTVEKQLALHKEGRSVVDDWIQAYEQSKASTLSIDTKNDQLADALNVVR